MFAYRTSVHHPPVGMAISRGPRPLMETAAEKVEPVGADKEFMVTLAKGLAVLRAFGEARPRMTLSEAAVEIGLSRASARRILRTLAGLGYVEQDGRHFAP